MTLSRGPWRGNRGLIIARGTLWGACAGVFALLGAVLLNAVAVDSTWSVETVLLFLAAAIATGAATGLLVALIGWRFVSGRTHSRARIILVVTLASAFAIAVVAFGMALFTDLLGSSMLPAFAVWVLVLLPALPVCMFALWHTRRALMRREEAVTQQLVLTTH